jgi:hypothetical protein
MICGALLQNLSMAGNGKVVACTALNKQHFYTTSATCHGGAANGMVII